jgi:hypothetical protein
VSAKKADSVKLRFGPYAAPRTHRGVKLFCEIRGTVTVGGYSDGPIPRPRIKKGGGHTLILFGSLVRAVRKEALIAVAHHWGVSQTIVWKWRRALDVARWNEGSTALTREWEAGSDDWIGLGKDSRSRGRPMRDGRARWVSAVREGRCVGR